MKVHIENIGCFKNLVDSERLLFAIEQMGIEVSFGRLLDFADIAIINTCGFIQDAEIDSSVLIRQYAALKTQGIISQLWVMGCYGQKIGERLKRDVPEVDLVFGNFDWDNILIRLGHARSNDIDMRRHITTPSHYTYLKISEGCNRPCSYCIKPMLNGPLKSIPMERLVEEVKWLVEQGVCEFQLVAQNLTDYGVDLYGERKITELVERISDIPGVEWIRLHYAYPIGFPSSLLDVMRERSNVCKYLDMAVQHCNPEMLKRMHRTMSKEELVSLLSEIRDRVPGIYLRTTLMVGFPGETDEMFDELCTFVKEQDFERMGVFRYSAQTESYSYKNYIDTVPESIKTSRALTLMNIQKEKYHSLNTSLVGTVQKVIVDCLSNGKYYCRTEHSTPMADPKIIVDSKRPLKIGSFLMARITESIGKDMRGIIL